LDAQPNCTIHAPPQVKTSACTASYEAIPPSAPNPLRQTPGLIAVAFAIIPGPAFGALDDVIALSERALDPSGANATFPPCEWWP